jgi:hypothetical protein
MKYLILGLLIALTGCAQLMQGQQQPVTYKNLKEKIMFTTCSGSVEYWGSCFEKAKATCPNGYKVLEKNENPTSGRRDLTFQCQ